MRHGVGVWGMGNGGWGKENLVGLDWTALECTGFN